MKLAKGLTVFALLLLALGCSERGQPGVESPPLGNTPPGTPPGGSVVPPPAGQADPGNTPPPGKESALSLNTPGSPVVQVVKKIRIDGTTAPIDVPIGATVPNFVVFADSPEESPIDTTVKILELSPKLNDGELDGLRFPLNDCDTPFSCSFGFSPGDFLATDQNPRKITIGVSDIPKEGQQAKIGTATFYVNFLPEEAVTNRAPDINVRFNNVTIHEGDPPITIDHTGGAASLQIIAADLDSDPIKQEVTVLSDPESTWPSFTATCNVPSKCVFKTGLAPIMINRANPNPYTIKFFVWDSPTRPGAVGKRASFTLMVNFR